MRIAIITPSRLKPSTLAGKAGQYFLEHAIASANAQELDRPATIHFFVGIDPGIEIPARLAAHPQVTFARGPQRGQIPALNAAIAPSTTAGTSSASSRTTITGCRPIWASR